MLQLPLPEKDAEGVSIPELAAKIEVEFHGNTSSGDIDALNGLSLNQINAVLEEKRRQLHLAALFDGVCERLKDLTPPPDYDEDEAEDRKLNEESRQSLIQEGCPPCYEGDLSEHVNDEIVQFWLKRSFSEFHPLWDQLQDWRRFHRAFGKIRSFYKRVNRPMTGHLNRAHDRLRKHGLQELPTLRLDMAEQSREETWTEFLYWHLTRYDGLEERMKSGKEYVAGLVANGEPEAIIDGVTRACPKEENLERYQILLRWIEQERQRLIAERLASNTAASVASSAVRRSTRIKRALRSQPPDPKRPVKRSQASEGRLSSKTDRAAGAKPDPRSRRRSIGVERSLSPRLPQPASLYKTRSGRISKPPLRWAPSGKDLK